LFKTARQRAAVASTLIEHETLAGSLQFDEEYGKAGQQTDLVAFLGGYELSGKAWTQDARHSAQPGTDPNGISSFRKI